MLVRAAYTIGFLCLVGAAGWGLHGVLTTQDDDGFLQWRDPAVTAAGRVLYASHCASCHGMPDGSVKPTVNTSAKAPPLHDASGHTWEHPDFALFQLVRDGVAVANCVPLDPELMPKFKGVVTDAELVAILSYIKSTWPKAVRQNHDRVNMVYGPYNKAVQKLIGTGSSERS